MMDDYISFPAEVVIKWKQWYRISYVDCQHILSANYYKVKFILIIINIKICVSESIILLGVITDKNRLDILKSADYKFGEFLY